MLFKFKSLMVCALAAATLSLSSAQAAEYVEGVNYQKRAEVKSPAPEIREFFSFWCGHCRGMQSVFDEVEEHFKDRAKFVRNPVNMLGGAMGPESQKALVVASMLGIEDLFVNELFIAMHDKHEIPRTHADMVYFFESLGIDDKRFERDYNSFVAAGKVAQFDKFTEDLKIDAVPEIAVNGKYIITMESVNNTQELIDLIDYVLTLD